MPTEGAEPPDWPNRIVPVETPEATKDTRIPSILAWVRAVLLKALKKSPPFILSKALAGKLVSEVHPLHVLAKCVPLEVSISGKLVSEVQLYHVLEKLVPLEVSISGKLVSEVQRYHV